MMKYKNYYLQRHRLSDVIALIQVLALDEHTHRSPNELKSELQGNPKSGGPWGAIAKEHPEFFRFNEPKHIAEGLDAHTISLVARHVLRKDTHGFRELPPDFTKKLIETAIELHDKELERSDKWKVWLPLFIAIITVLSSFYLQYRNNESQAFLKHYEVELKPKQEAYSKFMQSLSTSYFAAENNEVIQLNQSLDFGENNFYIVDPFLNANERDSIWHQYIGFKDFCYSIIESNTTKKYINNNTSATYLRYRDFFRTTFNRILFSQ